MPEVFDGERIRPVQNQVQHQVDPPAGTQPDTELTLGPKLLLGGALGLVLLCSLCFWLGYVIGGHGHNSSINQQPDASALPASSSASKPSAAAPGAFQPQSTPSSPSSSDASGPAAGGQTSGADAAQPDAEPADQSAPASDR